MKELSVISGTVSHIDTRASVTGGGSSGLMMVTTTHTALFRVDNRPTKFQGAPNLAPGEQVTAVGYDDGEEFRAVALRNDSTQTVYRYRRLPNWPWWVVVGIASFLAANSRRFLPPARRSIRRMPCRHRLLQFDPFGGRAGKAPAPARDQHAPSTIGLR